MGLIPPQRGFAAAKLNFHSLSLPSGEHPVSSIFYIIKSLEKIFWTVILLYNYELFLHIFPICIYTMFLKLIVKDNNVGF